MRQSPVISSWAAIIDNPRCDEFYTRHPNTGNVVTWSNSCPNNFLPQFHGHKSPKGMVHSGRLASFKPLKLRIHMIEGCSRSLVITFITVLILVLIILVWTVMMRPTAFAQGGTTLFAIVAVLTTAGMPRISTRALTVHGLSFCEAFMAMRLGKIRTFATRNKKLGGRRFSTVLAPLPAAVLTLQGIILDGGPIATFVATDHILVSEIYVSFIQPLKVLSSTLISFSFRRFDLISTLRFPAVCSVASTQSFPKFWLLSQALNVFPTSCCS